MTVVGPQSLASSDTRLQNFKQFLLSPQDPTAVETSSPTFPASLAQVLSGSAGSLGFFASE